MQSIRAARSFAEVAQKIDPSSADVSSRDEAAGLSASPPSPSIWTDVVGGKNPYACDAHTRRSSSPTQIAWQQSGELWPQRSEIQRVRHGLYITNYFGARKLKALEMRGISHIVVCGDELPVLFPLRFDYLKLHGLTDNTHTPLRPHLLQALRFVAEARREHGRILFHCASGSSRSGAVLIACLMATEQVSYLEALQMARRARPIVHPNAGFVEQLSEESLAQELRQVFAA